MGNSDLNDMWGHLIDLICDMFISYIISLYQFIVYLNYEKAAWFLFWNSSCWVIQLSFRRRLPWYLTSRNSLRLGKRQLEILAYRATEDLTWSGRYSKLHSVCIYIRGAWVFTIHRYPVKSIPFVEPWCSFWWKAFCTAGNCQHDPKNWYFNSAYTLHWLLSWNMSTGTTTRDYIF